MRKMGRPASRNQNTNCTKATLGSKGASSFGKSFVRGAEKLHDSNSSDRMDKQPVLFRVNQEFDRVLHADRLHPLFYSPQIDYPVQSGGNDLCSEFLQFHSLVMPANTCSGHLALQHRVYKRLLLLFLNLFGKIQGALFQKGIIKMIELVWERDKTLCISPKYEL